MGVPVLPRQGHGLSFVDGAHPDMDGQKHRFRINGGKPGEQAGFHVGHLDGHPARYIKNNRTGVEMTWKSKCYVLNLEHKAQLQAEGLLSIAPARTESIAQRQ